ncbi:Tn3 family transposase [Amycolatopsis taiwanensis]|uniref:Tn3 family transposase n=1 Tax=Amycolatopsis taiwanensis TaxID=342230 RepID=UPI0004B6F5F3|nr:Tn3 family transposase [Amycolatopsis taiwanensis]
MADSRRWNAVIFYGKDGDLTGPDREHAEVSMLALHLPQSVLVHINTLLQAVLEVPQFHDGVGRDERRALTPLFWTHINPYGRFRLNMDTRLELGRISGASAHPTARIRQLMLTTHCRQHKLTAWR